MAINVNVSVAKSVTQINEDSLTLVIFKNARYDGVTGPVRINTVSELYENFADPTTIIQSKELYSAEYLLRAGVNLLCYATDEVGTIDAGDITNIEDIEVLNYKLIVAPYVFLSATNAEAPLLTFVKTLDNDVQLFMDLEPFDLTGQATITALSTTVSSKLEICVNSGLASFTSNYDLIPNDFYIETPDTYDEDTDFVGIPASLAVAVRKAKLLDAGTPWIPVAGETYGMINEFSKLFTSLSTSQKETLQALNLNVLFTKIGIGNLFVSQNTMVSDTDSQLVRSHVVTEALWIKRQLKLVAGSLMYTPNNSRTWNTFRAKADKLFTNLLNAEGIEEYHVSVGLGRTMTAQDITDGKFKAFVSFLPIRLIEDITFSVVIQTEEDNYEVTMVGGDL